MPIKSRIAMSIFFAVIVFTISFPVIPNVMRIRENSSRLICVLPDSLPSFIRIFSQITALMKLCHPYDSADNHVLHKRGIKAYARKSLIIRKHRRASGHLHFLSRLHCEKHLFFLYVAAFYRSLFVP